MDLEDIEQGLVESSCGCDMDGVDVSEQGPVKTFEFCTDGIDVSEQGPVKTSEFCMDGTDVSEQGPTEFLWMRYVWGRCLRTGTSRGFL
jgi:hypothetical protein